MDRVPKNIRSGQGPVYVEAEGGRSLEQSIVKITTEVYSLVIRHVGQSGRTHPHPYDFRTALKVVLLPSYSRHEVVAAAACVTHIEDADSITEGSRRAKTLATLLSSARLAAGADFVQLEQRTRSKEPEDSTGSLFPAPKPVSAADKVHLLTALSAMFQMSDMPDELVDEFCYCDDKTQLQDNDMFLMASADKLWNEYLEQSDSRTRSFVENTLIKAVIASDKAYAQAEAKAMAESKAEQEEEEEVETGQKEGGEDEEGGE